MHLAEEYAPDDLLKPMTIKPEYQIESVIRRWARQMGECFNSLAHFHNWMFDALVFGVKFCNRMPSMSLFHYILDSMVNGLHGFLINKQINRVYFLVDPFFWRRGFFIDICYFQINILFFNTPASKLNRKFVFTVWKTHFRELFELFVINKIVIKLVWKICNCFQF